MGASGRVYRGIFEGLVARERKHHPGKAASTLLTHVLVEDTNGPSVLQ